MLKSILVAVDGSEYSPAAVEYGAALSRKEGARLTLLTVIDIVTLEGPFLADLSGSVGLTPFLDFQDKVRKLLTDKASAILEGHVTSLAGKDVTCETKTETGIISRVICQEANKHDIVILGRRGEHASWKGFLLGSTVEEVVRGSSRPILVTPREVKPLTKILVACDGSKPASRALGVTAAVAEDLGLPVVAVTASKDSGAAAKILEEAERFLEPHGLEITKVHAGGRASEEIPKAAEKEGCDLIIMGAFGHSRVREFLLGSTTDSILRNTRIPVLLCR